MLGAMQHGHIADVGYDMYMKLLGEAVSEAKGEKAPSGSEDCVIDIQIEAHIPEGYISELSHRLEMYRRIADIRTPEDESDVIDELIDRFGDPPKTVLGLTDVALVRSAARMKGVNAVRERDGRVWLYFTEIRCEGAAEIMEAAGKSGIRANLDIGAKPCISLEIRPGETALSTMKKILINN